MEALEVKMNCSELLKGKCKYCISQNNTKKVCKIKSDMNVEFIILEKVNQMEMKSKL